MRKSFKSLLKPAVQHVNSASLNASESLFPIISSLNFSLLPANTMQFCPTEYDQFSLTFHYFPLLPLCQQQKSLGTLPGSPVPLLPSHRILTSVIISGISSTLSSRQRSCRAEFHWGRHRAHTKK